MTNGKKIINEQQQQDMRMVPPEIIAAWVGDLYLSLKTAQREIVMLKEENLKLSAKLGKCQCGVKEDDKKV